MNPAARILVPCLDWTAPVPDARKLYRHVDVLNAHGFAARVLHQQPGFRCTWFDNRTAVSSFGEIAAPRPGDVLLVPEILAWQFVDLWPGTPKVIFSQNAYRTFTGRTDQYNFNPYLHADFRAVITVSEDSAAYLRYAFPRLEVLQIRYSVDPALYHSREVKKRQIAFVPGNGEDVTQVLGILRFRRLLAGWNILPVHELPEPQAAKILRESAIFLTFARQEGWGLISMEAMACGCAVIGYDARGGAEYFKEPFATPIDPEDIPTFAAAAERAIRRIQTDQQSLLSEATRSSQYIHGAYSPETEAADIVAAWQKILETIPHSRQSSSYRP